MTSHVALLRLMMVLVQLVLRPRLIPTIVQEGRWYPWGNFV
jgi:hypothetical protein